MVSTPTRARGQARAADTARGDVAGPPGRASKPEARGPPKAAARRWPGCRGWYRRFWSALEGTGKSRNGSTYYLILGSTLALTAIGIMMVLSASSVEAIAAGESPYSAALKQGHVRGHRHLPDVHALADQRRLAEAPRLAGHHRGLWPAGAGAADRHERQRQQELDRHRRSSPSSRPRPPSWPWRSGWPRCSATKAKLLHRWQHAVIPVVPVAARHHRAGPRRQRPRHRHDHHDDHGRRAVFRRCTRSTSSASRPWLGVAATAVMAMTSSNRMCRITSWWTGQSCGDGIGRQLPVHQRPLRAGLRRLVRRRAWARAGRSTAGFRKPTTTSFSPSSARNSAWWAPSSS